MKNGVDKGFCVAYYALSYRRKFIRTLWVLAFSPLLLLLHQIPTAHSFISYLWIFFFTVVVGVAQATYNYKKWKQEEGE